MNWQSFFELFKQNSLSEIKQQYGFPFLLKQRLIEEWYVVESQQRFLPLPRVPNVKQILQTVFSVLPLNPSGKQNARPSQPHLIRIRLRQSFFFSRTLADPRPDLLHEQLHGPIYHLPSGDAAVRESEAPEALWVHRGVRSGTSASDSVQELYRKSNVVMIPMMYSSTDLSERESEMIHEVMMGLYQFLLRHPTYFCNLEEYTTLDESIKHLFVLYFVLCIPLLFPLNSTGEGHTRDSLQDIQRIASR